MNRRRTRPFSALMALAVGSTLALSGCGSTNKAPASTDVSQASSEAPASTPATEASSTPTPTPTPQAEPVWEDLAGKWCAAEGDDCFEIDNAARTITTTYGKQVIKRDADSAASSRPPRGCFAGAVMDVDGPGAAGLYACLEDVKAPKTTESGVGLSSADQSKARIWEGQDSVWNIVYYRETAESAE